MNCNHQHDKTECTIKSILLPVGLLLQSMPSLSVVLLLVCRQDPEEYKEHASMHMQAIAHHLMQDLFYLEVLGVHLVEIKMEAARLVSLMNLRQGFTSQ